MRGVQGTTRFADSSEIDNRADWWLREFGRFPTRAQLLRIRAYRRAESKAGAR